MLHNAKTSCCPNCGAPLSLVEGEKSTRCEYCGSFFRVPDAPQRTPSGPVITLNVVTSSVNPQKVYSSGRLGQLHKDYDDFDARWKAAPPLRPYFTPKESLPVKTGLFIWIILLGLAALTFLGVTGIL